MPVYSMTGYATASAGPADATSAAADGASGNGPAKAQVSVEMRSVNGRFLDLALRLPDELRALEPALRELVAARVRRGKVELRIGTAREAESGWPQPATEQLSRLSRLESTVHPFAP